MGYGFRNNIRPDGMTPEQIEDCVDFIIGRQRGKHPLQGVCEYGVYRPRKLKQCCCGGHSLRKPTLGDHDEFVRYSIALARRAKVRENAS